MKLIDIIKDRKCKVCDSVCKVKVMGKSSISTVSSARKSIEASVKTEFGLEEDSIFIKKTIPGYNIVVLESYISLPDEKYHVINCLQSAQAANKFILAVVASCNASRIQDHLSDSSSKEEKQMTGQKPYHSNYSNDDADDSDDSFRSHYEDTYGVSIDTLSKDDVIKVVRLQERMEDEEYSMTKTFGSSPSTRILRKQKSITLSFSYDKDIKDLDFIKLLEMTKLLK